MPNVVIYPQGNGTITNPYVMMDDGTNKMALEVQASAIVVSSSTNSSSTTIADTTISSGTTVTISAPTTATTTATALSGRYLNTYLATLKNWTLSG